MAEFGYDSAMIEEGRNLFTQTRQAYDDNVREDDETSQAYADFIEKRNTMEDIYSLHRKKAKVIFRKDLVIMKRLALDGSVPGAYVKWFETVKKFYSEVISDKELETKLQRLKITAEDLLAAKALISKLETARSEYMREKGESQDATNIKHDAFA